LDNRRKIIRVLSQVIGVPEENLDQESSPDTVEAWNSVSHIHLVLALEQEFGVTLSPQDAVEMLSVRLIELILQERGVVFDGAPSAVG
jgi:acyl carrier protein